jgi:transcriptional regulator with XRE-family HTH domain
MKHLIDPTLLDNLMDLKQKNGAQLGRQAGTSRQFIHQLRTGKRTSCTDATAIAIAAALGVRTGALFRDAADERPRRRVAA